MLGRAIVPRLRPRLFPPPIRLALSNSQIRAYARDRGGRSDTDYKIPASAQKPVWQHPQTTSQLKAAPKRQDPKTQPEEEFKDVSSKEYSDAPPVEELQDGRSSHPIPEPPPFEELGELRRTDSIPKIPKPQPLDPKNDFQESVPFEPERVQPHANADSSESAEQPAETEAELRRRLPDLTQGIPSTLAAELGRGRAQQEASPASLNITEDPSEPIAGTSGGGRGEDGLPRSSYISSSDQKRNAAIKYAYLAMATGVILYAAYLGRNWADEEEEKKHASAPSGWGVGLFYNRVKARLGSTMDYYTEPMTPKLLPDEDKDPLLRFPFTLVLSMEDLLIHQEWTRERGWRIAKRPGVDYFLRYLTQYYELVLFTSQPSSMADQVLRKLDPYTIIRFPLFREATLYKDGGYIKDLSYLNRPLNKVLIIDTDPHHVKHQPENAIIIPKWTGDPKDQTLVQLIPFLEYLATMGFDDARPVLKSFEGTFIPAEFQRREKLLRQKFEEKRAEERRGKPKTSVSALTKIFGIKGPQLLGPDGLPIRDEPEDGTKMLWDQIRERGQKQYAMFEKQIREEGEKWLAERAEEEKKFQEEQMKSMKSGFVGWFGGKKE